MAFDHSQFRTGEHLVINVGGDIRNVRLDNYLCSRFGQLSRAKMQRIIKHQDILVNGLKAKPSRKLSEGDVIELDLPSKELIPEEIPLEIIHEDDDIIVLNKQAGVIIHPARGNASGTLLNGLINYANQHKPNDAAFVPDVVHRLDKETSGTIVFSKNEQVNTKLSLQFQERSTKKVYYAIVHGNLLQKTGIIDQPIGIDDKNPERYTVRPDGKEAITLYKVLENFDGYSLVEIELKTGRTHQIRVHMSHVGHPLVADVMYGGKKVYGLGPLDNNDDAVQLLNADGASRDGVENDDFMPVMGRVALHAKMLSFIHPATGKQVFFESKLPDDFQSFLGWLKCKSVKHE